MAYIDFCSLSPISIEACEFGVSIRDYDCENCECLYADCPLGDKIIKAKETHDYSDLPEFIQERLFLKDLEQAPSDTHTVKSSWQINLNPKRLP